MLADGCCVTLALMYQMCDSKLGKIMSSFSYATDIGKMKVLKNG